MKALQSTLQIVKGIPLTIDTDYHEQLYVFIQPSGILQHKIIYFIFIF